MMAAGSDVLAAGADELPDACSRHAIKNQWVSLDYVLWMPYLDVQVQACVADRICL